jgi:hypothetical protein
MGCATQNLRAFWSLQLTRKYAQWSTANDTLDQLLGLPITDYRLDTTEGEQQTRRQKITDLKKVIELLESEIADLERKLSGCGGLVSLNMRRSPC